MSTPKAIYTRAGPEISLDPNRAPGGELLLQMAITESREPPGSHWRLITDLTAGEAADLRDHLSNWLAGDFR